MMLLTDALKRAEAALRSYAAKVGPITPLNANDPIQESFVFRASVLPTGSLIAKVAAPGRLAGQFSRLRACHPQMNSGLYRVPEALAYDTESGVLLMEDAWGMTAGTIWRHGQDGQRRVLAAAGGWLARYHRLTATRTAFNPDPHVNWLRKTIESQAAGERVIPDFDHLQSCLPELERRAEIARGASSTRAVTHGDFHLRNLIIRKQGRCFGIDMENAGRDEVMRDLLFFLLDVASCSKEADVPKTIADVGRELGRSYRHTAADPEVCAFYQYSFALNHWAGLDAGASGLNARRQRNLSVVQLMLCSDSLLS